MRRVYVSVNVLIDVDSDIEIFNNPAILRRITEWQLEAERAADDLLSAEDWTESEGKYEVTFDLTDEEVAVHPILQEIVEEQDVKNETA